MAKNGIWNWIDKDFMHLPGDSGLMSLNLQRHPYHSWMTVNKPQWPVAWWLQVFPMLTRNHRHLTQYNFPWNAQDMLAKNVIWNLIDKDFMHLPGDSGLLNLNPRRHPYHSWMTVNKPHPSWYCCSSGHIIPVIEWSDAGIQRDIRDRTELFLGHLWQKPII